MARYYFAYASNLSLSQMHSRCKKAQEVAAVTAKGWRLGFYGESTKRWGQGGVATLIDDSAASTPGALYLLSEEDELAMDGFEGVAQSSYFKDAGFANHISCPQVLAGDTIYAYLKTNLEHPNPPSANYLNVICKGYLDWTLPGHPLGTNK